MENSSILKPEDHIELPPGFRFHPTDEELITHYLSKKFMDSNFTARAIGDVDLNKCEPWDLPWRAKMGEKQWYFFCVRDRKYPTGLRTNRATEAGYWKATGKDREIYKAKTLVGMKKTLVFYKGRAPKGEKTNWVMHEYRLEGKYLYNLPKTAKNEWVICRIFQKGSGGKKTVSESVRMNSFEEAFGSVLPPLMDSPYSNQSNPQRVTCFSTSMEGQIKEEDSTMSDVFHSPLFINPANSYENSMIFSKLQLPSLFSTAYGPSSLGNLQHQGSIFIQDKTFLREIIESHGSNLKYNNKSERDMVSISQETGLTSDINAEISSVVSNYEMGRRAYEETEDPSSSAGPVDLDCLWNY